MYSTLSLFAYFHLLTVVMSPSGRIGGFPQPKARRIKKHKKKIRYFFLKYVYVYTGSLLGTLSQSIIQQLHNKCWALLVLSHPFFPATLQIWLISTALIALFSASVCSCFQQQKNPPKTYCFQPKTMGKLKYAIKTSI